MLKKRCGWSLLQGRNVWLMSSHQACYKCFKEIMGLVLRGRLIPFKDCLIDLLTATLRIIARDFRVEALRDL